MGCFTGKRTISHLTYLWAALDSSVTRKLSYARNPVEVWRVGRLCGLTLKELLMHDGGETEP